MSLGLWARTSKACTSHFAGWHGDPPPSPPSATLQLKVRLRMLRPQADHVVPQAEGQGVLHKAEVRRAIGRRGPQNKVCSILSVWQTEWEEAGSRLVTHARPLAGRAKNGRTPQARGVWLHHCAST